MDGIELFNGKSITTCVSCQQNKIIHCYGRFKPRTSVNFELNKTVRTLGYSKYDNF